VQQKKTKIRVIREIRAKKNSQLCGKEHRITTIKKVTSGSTPEIILAGRRLNDNKENCPDMRNTRVIDLVKEFKSFNCNVDVYDPWIDREEAQHEYDITPVEAPVKGKYDAIILAVAHNEFKEMGTDAIRQLGRENHVLYDIKYILNADEVDGRL